MYWLDGFAFDLVVALRVLLFWFMIELFCLLFERLLLCWVIQVVDFFRAAGCSFIVSCVL